MREVRSRGSEQTIFCMTLRPCPIPCWDHPLLLDHSHTHRRVILLLAEVSSTSFSQENYLLHFLHVFLPVYLNSSNSLHKPEKNMAICSCHCCTGSATQQNQMNIFCSVLNSSHLKVISNIFYWFFVLILKVFLYLNCLHDCH